jgi:caa(3)-type oxidase subunit IV
MTDSAATPAPTGSEYRNYALYWKAWAALLAITLLMVFLHSHVGMIIVGMIAKATIIMAWFMHLKAEKLDFILYVVLSIAILSAFLFGLILPDGSVM